MAETITDAALEQISRAVAANTGLQFFRERRDDLKRAIKRAYSDAGFDHPVLFVQWLLNSLDEEDRIEFLINRLTVGETHFFRHDKQFAIFREKLLPRLLESRRQSGRRLRIWSAGCSTGEEPYSIAITLLRKIPDLTDWNISILATDINRNFLEKASKGIYSEWSFRDVPEKIKKGYFKTNGDGYRIFPEVKRMVTFSHLNLVKEEYPSCLNGTDSLDVIFCRNVLMYFAPERQSQVLERLCRCLVDGGWLVVSPAEASVVLHSDLNTVTFPGVIVYQKRSRDTVKSGDFRLDFQFPLFQPAADSASLVPQHSWAPHFTSLPEEISTPPHEAIAEPETEPPTTIDASKAASELYDQGQYAEAAETLLDLLEADPIEDGDSATLLSLLTRSYANLGHLDEAERWSEKAIAADTVNPDYYYLHATILQEQGKLDEAIVSLTRAVFLDPNCVVAHFSLGNLARVEGNMAAANKHYKNALQILSNYEADETVPASDGMTVGELRSMILTVTGKEIANE